MLDQCLGGIDVASAIFGNQRSKAGNAIRIWYCGGLLRPVGFLHTRSLVGLSSAAARLPAFGVEAFTHVCVAERRGSVRATPQIWPWPPT